MKSEFHSMKISSLCSLISSGGTPSRKKDEYYQGGNINWLKTKELFDTNIYDTEEHITNLGLKKSSAKLYPVNTVVMAMYGATVGQLGIMKSEMSTNQACCCMVIDDNVADYRYLFYSLLLNRSALINLANGAAQQNLNSQTIKDFEIDVPPLPTQKKIAHILSTLDDKIELNRKMNQTLEEMAQAIFKSWFVDFDPVHAKANCISDAEIEAAAKELGISKEVLDLFPGEFEESELGMIPKGWKLLKLGEITKFQQGKQIELEDQFPTLVDELIRFVRIIDHTSDSEAPRYIKADKNWSSYVTEDDVVMIRYGSQTAGKVVIGKSGIIANNMFRVIPIIDSLPRMYLYYFLKSPIVYSYLRGGQSSSTMPAITFGLMSSIDIFLPQKKILGKFNELIKTFIAKQFENKEQIKKLKETRDTLLPKLLSGELNVSEIELDME